MPPVPKKKHTSGRTRRRRNSPAHKRTLPNLSPCPECKKPKRSHIACPSCGHYK